MKKHLLLLALSMLTAFSASAYIFSLDNADGVTIYYEINTDGTLTVTYKDAELNSYSGNVVLPETVNVGGTDYVISTIGESAFGNCSGLTGVTIPSSVTTIEDAAFYYCKALQNVELPAGLTTIGASAFRFCESFTNVEIPDGVTTIGRAAFYDCRNIMTLSLSNSLTAIPADAFGYCMRLESLVVPSSVTSIGETAFQGCQSLTELYIPSSVTAIDNQAFRACSGLAALTVDNPDPSTITLGSDVFKYVETANAILYVLAGAVTLYDSIDPWKEFGAVETIFTPGYSFVAKNDDGINIYYLINEDRATVSVTIRRNTYNSYSGDVVIPATVKHLGTEYTVTEIGTSAFESCPGLTSVTMPSTITTIGGFAFNGSTSLASVVMSPAITEIHGYAFSNCSALTSIEIPDGVTFIGNNAFAKCYSLTQVSLPASLTYLYQEAFADCTALTTVNIAAPLTYIQASTFANCKNLTTINLPATVVDIDDYAFSYCESLESIELPEALTDLGYRAFAYCAKLADVKIGSNIKFIRSEAFEDCSSLANVTVNVFDPADITVADDAFLNASTASATLFVPYGSKGFYDIAPVWKDFGTIMEMASAMPETLIDATEGADAPCYDLMGRRVESPTHGFYIVGGRKILK